MSAHSTIKGWSCKRDERIGSWNLFSEYYKTVRQNLLEECCTLVCSASKEGDKIRDPSTPNSNLCSFSSQTGKGRAGVDLCNFSPHCEISKNKIRTYIKGITSTNSRIQMLASITIPA